MISCQEQHGEELPYHVIGGVSHKCTSHTSGLHQCLCPFQSITPPLICLFLSLPQTSTYPFLPPVSLSHSLVVFIHCSCSPTVYQNGHQMLLTVQILFTLFHLIVLLLFIFCYAVSFQIISMYDYSHIPSQYAYFTKLRSIALKTINNSIYVGDTFIMAQHQNDGIFFY